MFTHTLPIFFSFLAIVVTAMFFIGMKLERIKNVKFVNGVVPIERVCYDRLGCFENDAPWRTNLRPVPLPQPPDRIPTMLWFYSRQNKNTPYRISVYPEIQFGKIPFDGRRPTLVVVHGFNDVATMPWLINLKDVYLEVMDANVLLTDWSFGVVTTYMQTISNIRVVGRMLSNAVGYLIEKKGLKPDSVHLVGHSMGAHICSYIGKDIPGIGRLTALDPAQPGFETADRITRLDKTDATFVEVVHTDSKPFVPFLGVGMMAPHGHVDFYFNSGSNQPGCLVPDDLPKVLSIRDLALLPIEYSYRRLSCSHQRAQEYLIEAYNKSNKCVFWGHRVKVSHLVRYMASNILGGLLSDLNHRYDICTKKKCIPFGLDAINSPLRGIFVVKTNYEPPYCLPEPWGYSNYTDGDT